MAENIHCVCFCVYGIYPSKKIRFFFASIKICRKGKKVSERQRCCCNDIGGWDQKRKHVCYNDNHNDDNNLEDGRSAAAVAW